MMQQTLQIGATDLVQTKLVPPHLRPQLVARSRLLDRLDDGLSGKLTLVSAPAGCGKTTLVADWLRGQTARLGVAWVALDAGDNDPLRFWRYVLAACQTLDHEVGATARNLLRVWSRPDYERALTLLLNDFSQLTGKSVLVLEDYHLITNAQIQEQLAFLLDHLPSLLHLVMITRSDPPLPLARLRVQNHLHELRADDLHFSLAETHTFLRQTLPFALPDEAVTRLHERTEGWVAGLHLLALALGRHSDAAQANVALTELNGQHRHLASFFGSEIVAAQPEPIQRFLLQTSVLEHLSAPLCDAVTEGDHSATFLEYLERANLFLVPLDQDGQWYRYHALFAQSLQHLARRQLGEAALLACYERASRWYEAQGSLAEAVEAAFAAQSFERAAHLIAPLIGPQHFKEHLEYHTIRRWLRALPESVLMAHPQLCLRFAMLALFSGEGRSPDARAQIERALAMAERSWLAANNRAGVGSARAARALVEGELGVPSRAARLAEHARPWLGEEDYNWRAGCLRLIGRAHLLNGEIAQAAQTLREARTQFELARNPYGLRAALINLGDASTLGGELRQAAELYRAVSTAEGVELIDKSLALLGLAGLAYEWNDLDAAERDAREANRLAQRLHDEQLQTQSTVTLARVLFACDQRSEAQQMLYTLLARMQQPQLRRILEAEQARFALLSGDIVTAQRWYASTSRSEVAPSTLLHEHEALIAARLQLSQSNAHAALVILDEWQARAHASARTRSVLEIQLLSALSHSLLNNHDQARQLLVEVLMQAQPEGYVRVFLDSWPLLASLLRTVANDLEDETLIDYARRLIYASLNQTDAETAPIPPVTDSRVERLSRQELRVLQLLSAGHSNQRIAETLIVSINTVKTQLKSIYRKLDVANRVEATRLAQRLNLT